MRSEPSHDMFPFRVSRLCVSLLILPWGSAMGENSAGALLAPTVRVTADRLSIERDEASQPVRVIDRPTLERFAVRDVQRALNLLPNVFVQRTGSLFDEGSVQMYGISGQARAPTRTTIAINGVPINNGMFPETSLNLIPFNIVDRVEVIQGPGSSAYGNNAFTGVVNLVTRQPDHLSGNVTAQIGSRWGTSDNSAFIGIGKPGEGWGIASVQLRETLGNLQPGGRRDFSDSRLGNAAFAGERQLGETHVSAAFFHYEFDRHNPSLISRDNGPTPPGPTSYQEVGHRQHANLGIRHDFGRGFEGEIRYMYNTFSTDNVQTFRQPNPAQTPPTNEDRSGNGALARMTWTTDANMLQAGFEYNDAKLVNKLASGAQQREFTGSSNGFYVQDRLLLIDRQLSLSAGYRRDSFSFYDAVSNSGKLGFSFKPNGASWLVRGNWGRSFAAPAFNQLFNTAQPFGNRSLTAETLNLWELGGEVMPWETVRLGASYFRAKHTNPIFPRQANQCVNPVPGVGAGVNQFCNVFPAPEYHGVTLTADWAFSPKWTAGLSYTHTDPQTVSGNRGGVIQTNTYTFHSNRHLGKLLVSYAGERVSGGADLTWAQGRHWGDNFSTPVANYVVLNLRGAYRFDRHWSATATFFNVLNESFATRADRAVIAGVERFAGITQPGRHLMLGLSYDL